MFYSFFPKSKVLNSTQRCQIALGHCRKASVGAINEANAQPVVIKDELGEVKYVLIHNGTILNYEALAKKYIPDVDIKGMTDSQVMARIFYHKGYDVLGEYLGAGAFVMVDYRGEEPLVLLFKGESKSSQYSVTTSVERPLYCSYSQNEFIFSSIMDYLKPLRPNREVLTLSPNYLLCLKDGSLFIIKEYDRKSLWQTRSYTTYANNTASTYTPSKVLSVVRNSYNDYDEFGNGYWDDAIEMDTDGLYYVGATLANGTYWVDALGSIKRRKLAGTIAVSFWMGVLLYNSACYNYLREFAKSYGCSQDNLALSLPDLVHYLSPIPWRTSDGTWVRSDSALTNKPVTGRVLFPFTTESLWISGGAVSYYTENVPYSDTIKILKDNENYKIDADAISRTFGKH
jgi:hypothetical protein